MNPAEASAFHAAAVGCDSRLQPLTPISAKIWAHQLANIPANETPHILNHIYATPQLVVLQPGHVVEAWEAIKAERRRTVERIHSIDRYLAATSEDDPEVLEEKLKARAQYVAQLPAHVVEYAGVAQRQLAPPPKYRSDDGAYAEIVDIARAKARQIQTQKMEGAA